MAQERGAVIQSVGPQNLAQATLGLKGGDVPQNILVPDLLGTVELGRRNEPELLFDQDITLWRAFAYQGAGGAGQFSMHELLNPADVVSVFWFSFREAFTGVVEICLGVPAAPALAAATPIMPCDTRVGRAALDVSVPLLRSGTRAAVIGANVLYQVATNVATFDYTRFIGPFIMGRLDDQAADNHFVIENTTVNQALGINLVGYSLPRRSR